MAWQNHSVGVYDPIRKTYRKAKSRFSMNGVSDIVGIYKTKPLYIEVKTPQKRKNLSESQQIFIKNALKHGAIAFVACSIDDVKNELQKV